MKLKVDYRETKFHGLPGAEIENLQVGDFVIEGDDGVPVVIIERKTVNDMMSSLADGRYREQKCRLQAAPGKICYIIENFHAWSSAPNDTIRTIMVNLQLVNGFSLFTSRNDTETADIISYIYNKVNENPSKYSGQDAGQPSYASNVKTKKAENLDAKTCAVLQLCSIRRVTAKTAEAILGLFSTDCMGDFIVAVSALEKTDFVHRVAQLKPFGTMKRLGEKLGEDVYFTLFNR